MADQRQIPLPREARRDRTIQEYEHDVYKITGKLKEPTVCPKCGAVFHKGRWTWAPKPPGAHEVLCPACHRIRDRYPKGLLKLSGQFLVDHREELLGLAHNEEAKAKAEHPLSRIITIAEEDGTTLISTTDTHLPRRIGEALRHAYHGELNLHYNKDEEFIRVTWARET